MSDTNISILTAEWERAKAGAQEFIEAMPDESLGFRPVPDILSFAGQFVHIAYANYLFASPTFGAENPLKDTNPEQDPTLQSSKAALLEFVNASYDFILKGIATQTPESLAEEVELFRWKLPRHLILAKALEHHAHHRGQTVIYFRLQGFKPPSEHLF